MDARSAIRRAELLSTVGAGVLGAGVSLLLEPWVGATGLQLLVVGIVLHSFGMYQRRRLEDQGHPVRPSWENVLYWGCWILLAGLVAWIFLFRRWSS